MIDSGKDDGFVDRILLCFPEPVRSRWTEEEISTSLLDSYTELLDRICLILHILRSSAGEERQKNVSAESVAHAILLIEYFKSHAKKVYRYITMDDEERKILAALETIHKKGGKIYLRDAQRGRLGGCKTAEDVQALFEKLESQGYGSVEEELQKNGRGKKRIYFLMATEEDEE